MRQVLMSRSYLKWTQLEFPIIRSEIQHSRILCTIPRTKTSPCKQSYGLHSNVCFGVQWTNKLRHEPSIPALVRCLRTHRVLSNPQEDGKDIRNVSKDQQLKDIKENIYTIPNLLTGFRIAVTPYLGYLVLNDEFDLGFKLFILAGLSDLLDGYIARNFKGQQSVFGSALDPFADKLLVSVLTVTMTMANLLPMPLTFIIVGRDALLIGAGFYLRYITLPPPRTLSRYFDVSHATVTLLPSTLSKLNTGLQLCLITLSLAAPVFGFIDHQYLKALWYITGTTTLSSGIQYYISRNKYIRFSQEKLKREI